MKNNSPKKGKHKGTERQKLLEIDVNATTKITNS